MLPIFCSALLGVFLAQVASPPEQDPELARGIALERGGEYEQAIVVLDTVARRLGARPELAKDAAQAYFHLGFAYVAEGQDPLARTSFREAIRRDPTLELTTSDASPKVRQLFEQGRLDLRAEGGAPEPAPTPAPAATPAPPARPSPQPAATNGGSRRSHKGLLLAGVGAAAAAGAVVALAGGKVDPLTTDDDHDGFSEKAGDCNDADPAVNPNGGIAFTVDFALAGAFNCSVPNARVQTYTVRNNTCSLVTITSLTYATSGSGNCTFDTQADLRLSATSVASGASVVIRQGQPAGQGFALCCASYPCRAGECTIRDTYTVNTSAGSRTATNSFSVTDLTGRDCRACSDVFSPRIQGAPGTADACRVDP